MGNLGPLVLIGVLSTGAWANDAGLDQLRHSFLKQIQDSTSQFDKAATLTPIPMPPPTLSGNDISSDDCAALHAQIRPNYQIDPFSFIFENGSISNNMCADPEADEKNYLQSKTGTTLLGFPFTLVIQLDAKDPFGYRDELTNYFVDSSYKIVEIDKVTTNSSNAVVGYRVSAVDSAGNLYVSVYDQDFNSTGGIAQGVSGVHTLQAFVANDGSTPTPLIRNTVKHNSDASKDYQVFSWSRADQKDWTDFQLPITISDSGGY